MGIDSDSMTEQDIDLYLQLKGTQKGSILSKDGDGNVVFSRVRYSQISGDKLVPDNIIVDIGFFNSIKQSLQNRIDKVDIILQDIAALKGA